MDDTERNRKKREETGRNVKKREETGRHGGFERYMN